MPTTTTAKPLISPRPARADRSRPTPTKPRTTHTRAAAQPQPLRLSVVDINGHDRGITDKDAKRVFDRAHRAFKKNQPVEISFRGMGFWTASFVHGIIGSFYERYDAKEVRRLVKPIDLDERGARAVARAEREGKAYFADPEGYIALQKRIFDELEAEGWID